MVTKVNKKAEYWVAVRKLASTAKVTVREAQGLYTDGKRASDYQKVPPTDTVVNDNEWNPDGIASFAQTKVNEIDKEMEQCKERINRLAEQRERWSKIANAL